MTHIDAAIPDPPMRCFVTKIECVDPRKNRLVSRVTIRQDHAQGSFEGSFEVSTAFFNKIGQAFHVTLVPE